MKMIYFVLLDENCHRLKLMYLFLRHVVFDSDLSFIENDTHHINLMDSSEMQSHRYHCFSEIDYISILICYFNSNFIKLFCVVLVDKLHLMVILLFCNLTAQMEKIRESQVLFHWNSPWFCLMLLPRLSHRCSMGFKSGLMGGHRNT
jgi:hypothetical protein